KSVNWQDALERAIEEAGIEPGPAAAADMALLFASADYAEHLEAMVRRAQSATGAAVLAGCSGQGIIGPEREIEGEPAVSLMTLHLPGARLTASYITQQQVVACNGPAAWQQHTGVAPEDVNAWLMFADPFHLDVESLLDGFSAAYAGVPIIGGLASAAAHPHETFVFLNGEVHNEGAVAISLGGAFTLQTVVSQGCDPIGEPWIITGANGSIIETISQRPAYEVLVETLHSLPADKQQRAARNLLVGLAMDEYKERFGRGDFLIRGLMGADQKSGAIAIGAHPRVGQTIQFQIRDAAAADEDLRQLLIEAREALGDRRPVGAVLCSCNGRGEGLFGFPDHDARSLAQQLGAVPVAGFFCNGEIGPVGKDIFLHGFTASLGLIVPTAL
ncbi:MAG TPA: FIST N-terminal domain-containing protein, partial [Chloroflexota bacterium]|nr:FIST N-terminal domain-containing protein [Chloroflexota bacterium]